MQLFLSLLREQTDQNTTVNLLVTITTNIKRDPFPTLLITYTSLISSPPSVNINAVNNKAQPSHAGNVTHIKIKVQVLIPHGV